MSWAENQERLNLSAITSEKAFTSALKAYSQTNTNPLRGWYIAHGLPSNINITREDIDSVIPSVPCAVIDADNSRAILNSPAMSAVNMPQSDTEPDGLLKHLPPLSNDDIIYLVKIYASKANALGISEVWADFHDDGGRLWDMFSSDAYKDLSLRLRANFAFDDVNELNDFLASGLRTGDGLPFCKMGGFIVNDGIDQKAQKDIIISAHLSGCQVISTNDQYCIGILEQAMKQSRRSPRHLIRSTVFTSKLLDRMRRLGLGGILLAGSDENELHSAFQNGIVLSAGSGQTITPPLKAIGAMTAQGLSVAEAVNVYTWSASWNGSNDMRRGELERGSDADVVVLEQDPYLVKPAEIETIDVTMTFCAGSLVYDSGTI